MRQDHLLGVGLGLLNSLLLGLGERRVQAEHYGNVDIVESTWKNLGKISTGGMIARLG